MKEIFRHISGLIGAILGMLIFAFIQSKQGWTDGSWDTIRVTGVLLMGLLPGAIVNSNIKIGNNCKVSSGSVVRKSMKNNCIAHGNPAIIKKIY